MHSKVAWFKSLKNGPFPLDSSTISTEEKKNNDDCFFPKLSHADFT